jgi:hypothetical protein
MIRICRTPAPRADFKYNDEDIKSAVCLDFHTLCYLCEEYVPRQSEIDHFYPKGKPEFAHLEHDWYNLFYICHQCNLIRPKNINTLGEEVLNPCLDDVEFLVRFRMDKDGRVEIILQSKDPKSQRTRKLLNRIYNGIGSNNKTFGCLRKEICKELNKFQNIFEKFVLNPELYRNELCKRLSKYTNSEYSAYVSFKRQWIRDNHPEFIDLFD